jgi:hypothetical protein
MDDLHRRALLRGVTTFLAVAILGSLLVAVAGGGEDTSAATSPGASTPSPSVSPAPAEPQAWLAWVPGGLPSGFGDLIAGVPDVTATTTAAADTAWLTASFDANGDAVDQTRSPMMIPLDVTAVDPTFAAFVPQPERQLVQNLRTGEAIISEGEAQLRGLGPGATLLFEGGEELTVAGTLPNGLMGGYEVLVTRVTGRRIGVADDRYVLFHAKPSTKPTPEGFISAFGELLPADTSYPAVEVRAPGTTAYLRANDRALPPLLLKREFGEFQAHTGDSTLLVIDPRWVQENIRSATLPLLGTVTCNEKVLVLLKQAVRHLVRMQAADAITDVGACYDPTATPSDPSGPLTAAAWGASIELNPSANAPGDKPTQSKELVHELYRWGFGWGGNDAYPQGALFRFRKALSPQD